MEVPQKKSNLHTFIYDKNHTEFAGVYSQYDFNTAYPNPDRYIPFTRIELENRKKYHHSKHKTQERMG